MNDRPAAPRWKPFRALRTIRNALIALAAAGQGPGTKVYEDTRALGYRKGKHNGRCAGAFGGPAAAKGHRRKYPNHLRNPFGRPV